jgi:hypothetical protein
MENYPMYRLLMQKQDVQWLQNNFSRMMSMYTIK